MEWRKASFQDNDEKGVSNNSQKIAVKVMDVQCVVKRIMKKVLATILKKVL